VVVSAEDARHVPAVEHGGEEPAVDARRRFALIALALELARARQLAETLAANSPASLLATKRLLMTYSHVKLDHQIAAAVDENARIRTTHDFREGVNAFLEKRKPNWTGR